MSIAQTTNGYHHAKRRKLNEEAKERGSGRTAEANKSNNNEFQDGGGSDSEEEAANHSKSEPVMKRALTKSTNGLQISSRVITPQTPSSAALSIRITELLHDTKLNYASRLKKANSQVDLIKDAINSTPEQSFLSLNQAQAFAKKTLRVAIPWGHHPAPDVNYKFAFSQPPHIATTGALKHHFCLRGDTKLILMPEMPKDLFQEKDYLNYRAIHKRAFYLACIASSLRKNLQDEFEIKYGSLDDNILIPALFLTSKTEKKATPATTYVIHPCLPSSLGPVEKMLPGLSCLRKDDVGPSSSQLRSVDDWVYNGTIKALSAASTVEKLIEKVADTAENFRDACVLGAVWLRQRGFGSSQGTGGFGPHEWALMCSLLLQSGGAQGRPLFSHRYSALQLFKAILQVLSTRDMLNPLVVQGSFQIQNSDRPVMFDAATGTNVFYMMTPSSYARLKSTATISLAAINSQKVDGFDSTFISKVSDHVLQYDELYEIKLRDRNSFEKRTQFYEAIRRSLGDRVTQVDLSFSPSETWSMNTSSPIQNEQTIIIGLLINADTSTRLLDHGPLIEEKEAIKEFRDFWKEKAELRKFKDGRISESVTWSAESPVTQQIVSFLSLKYFNIQTGDIIISRPLETFRLRRTASAASNGANFTTVDSMFQSLASTLHKLDGLPLPVRSVMPASSYLRSSSITVPLESGSPPHIDVLIQFDTSGRWPDHLAAIQYTKIAFLTKISDLLVAADKSITTQTGLENTSTSHLGVYNTSFLDVSFQSSSPTVPPTIFRLRIYHDRELYLIQQELNSKSSLLPGPLRDTYQSALITQKRTYTAMPQHTTAIRNLITIYPPLSTTIRLLKQWIAAHHLTNHIPEPALEIICVNTFLSPLPWTIPGTATTAFARCLNFLSKWDWTREPLITDLSPSQDMTLEQRTELFTRFAAWRKLDPNLNTVAWFIGTNIDSTGVVWTQSDLSHKGPQPARVTAARVTALASAAVRVMKYTDETQKVQRTVMMKEDWDSILRSSVSDFDFVVHLKDSAIGKDAAKDKKKKQHKNLELASSLEFDTSGIDEVESFLEDLEEVFGSAALFFYGGSSSGNQIIGGLWRPHLRGEKTWKIRLGFSTIPIPLSANDEGEEPKCKANLDGMLAEIGTMGEGVIDHISQKE